MTEDEISVLLEAVGEMIEASENAVLDAVVAKLAEIENRVTDQNRVIAEFKAQVLADRDHDERQPEATLPPLRGTASARRVTGHVLRCRRLTHHFSRPPDAAAPLARRVAKR